MTDLEFQYEIEKRMRKNGSIGLFRAFGANMDIFMGSILAGENAEVPSPFDFALQSFYFSAAERADPVDLFSGFDIFGNAFVLNLLITLKVIAWSLLFVIPGIVAAYRYSMATYIMAENPGMQATEAIERSKALMDGRKGDLFCLDLSFIGWALLATLTAGIGYLWLTPYMTVSRAAFYRSLPRSMGDRAPNGWQPNPGPQPGGDWYSQN